METNMENMGTNERKNNYGMFYAVMGVATLVITVIGATFAYLTATTNSDVNAVTATGATISLGYSDVVTGLKQNLIPIDTDLSQFAKGTFTNTAGQTYSFAGIDANDCKDVNGNNICSVYTFTVSNPTSDDKVSQYIYATFEVGINTFNNLYFAVFKGTSAEVEASDGYTLGTSDTAVTALTTDYEDTSDANYAYTKNSSDATRKHVVANKGDLVVAKTKVNQKLTAGATAVTYDLNQQLNQYLDDGESMTYTIILWVDETGSAQDDQGKNFAGTVRFTTEGDSTGVTGDLDASS